MATDQEMDRVSGKVHSAALTLFRTTLDAEPKADDADIQAAAINGFNAAVATLLWRGRCPHATPDTIADNVRFAVHDLLCQMQRNGHN